MRASVARDGQVSDNPKHEQTLGSVRLVVAPPDFVEP